MYTPTDEDISLPAMGEVATTQPEATPATPAAAKVEEVKTPAPDASATPSWLI